MSTLLFVADSGFHCIRQVVLATGDVTTLAGSGAAALADGAGALAAFNTPSAVAADATGNLYVADTLNHCVRRIVIASRLVSTVAGSSSGACQMSLRQPSNKNSGKTFSVVCISRMLTLSRIEFVNLVSQLFCFAFVHLGLTGIAGFANGVGVNARFSSPGGLTVDAGSTMLLVADTSNHCVRRISLADTSVTTVAGSALSAAGFRDGAGTAALFNAPVALVLGTCLLRRQ